MTNKLKFRFVTVTKLFSTWNLKIFGHEFNAVISWKQEAVKGELSKEIILNFQSRLLGTITLKHNLELWLSSSLLNEQPSFKIDITSFHSKHLCTNHLINSVHIDPPTPLIILSHPLISKRIKKPYEYWILNWIVELTKILKISYKLLHTLFKCMLVL